MSQIYIALVALMLTCASVPSLAAQCLEYDHEVRLVGTLARKTFPEQPNYESIKKGDAAATYFFISPLTVLCVSKGHDESSRSVTRLAHVQLMVSGITQSYEALRPLLGKKVMCRGNLWPQISGHHHSPVLLAEAKCEAIHTDIEQDGAFIRLSKAHTEVTWSNSPIRIDIDCDGKADYAFLAQTPTTAFVGLVRGKPKAAVAMLKFEVAPDSQGGLCYLPSKIEAESLDYDPTEAVVPLSGFARSNTCNGFTLSGGDCDSFHFYWDKNTNRLSWWRL